MYVKLLTANIYPSTNPDAPNRRPHGRIGWTSMLSVLLFLLGLGLVAGPTYGEAASARDSGEEANFAHEKLASDDETTAAARHVILISVDGLRPDAITRHDPEDLPNFYRLRSEGAFTDNARTDVDYINTMPNHIAQLTGRPVTGEEGHGWRSNSDPGDETIHSIRGDYVSSVFDVLHESGSRSAAYVSKPKLAVLDRSYVDGDAGDETGEKKIDTFVVDSDTEDLVSRMVEDLQADPSAFTFLHIRDPDSKGHVWSWSLRSWSPYMRSVRRVDRMLGDILGAIDNDPRLAGNTIVILTADHGGDGWTHGRPSKAEDYTIPFYVWGSGVSDGELYELNADVRLDPGDDHPGFDASMQPIRNGDAANLALGLLGMEVIPGSAINAAADLSVGARATHVTAAE